MLSDRDAETSTDPTTQRLSMKIFTTLALAATLVLSAQAKAQSCSKLTATTSSTELKLAVSGGTANAITFLAVAESTGTTKLEFGSLGSLTLGLAKPTAILPIGMTNGDGALAVAFKIPAKMPAFDLKGQAVNAKLAFDRSGSTPKFGLSFCVSNVAAIKGGSSE